jgi:hypothetical protein
MMLNTIQCLAVYLIYMLSIFSIGKSGHWLPLYCHMFGVHKNINLGRGNV